MIRWCAANCHWAAHGPSPPPPCVNESQPLITDIPLLSALGTRMVTEILISASWCDLLALNRVAPGTRNRLPWRFLKMTFGASALSHVPQEMETSSSTPEFVFRVSDRLNQYVDNVRITQPDCLRRWSLGLRGLMEGATSTQILLKVDPDSGFDSAAVAWVLERLQRQELDVRPDPETLARHCAVLWKYECNPDPFKYLGDSLHPRSSSGSPSIDQQSSVTPNTSLSGGSRCWQGKKNNITCGQLITIAIVLGVREVLEEEIKNAVWGMNKEVKIAAPLEQQINVEAIRKDELGKLFDKVYHEIIDINDDNEKLGKSIRETLKQHELGNFSKSWKKNAEGLEKEKWTPYDFLRGIDNALAPIPETQNHEPRAQGGGRGRDVPHVNWTNLLNKTTKSMKVTLHVIDTTEAGGDQEKKSAVLDNLEKLVHDRYHDLAEELMTQRDSIVRAWKDKLERLNTLDHRVQT